MQNKHSASINQPNDKSDKIFFEHKENQSFKKVDMNVLLNRVKFEKKNEIKKNLILAQEQLVHSMGLQSQVSM